MSKAFDYRAKSSELDMIVADLQNPEIDIEEATKLHAQGLKLVGELEEYLKNAENEVKKHIATD